MSQEGEPHLWYPKLYNAPPTPRPRSAGPTEVRGTVDPDDLPIVAEQTPEERALLAVAAGLPASPNGQAPTTPSATGFRELAGRLLGRR